MWKDNCPGDRNQTDNNNHDDDGHWMTMEDRHSTNGTQMTAPI